jgi:histidinol phosphatase-like enzyme (inositol monophosphatase family)
MTADPVESLDVKRLAILESFALELGWAASAAILPLFRINVGIDDKGGELGFDPVTAADHGAERAIRAAIAARYPEHGVIGEEYGEDRPDAEFVWVVDPVDGTRAFISGLPLWTTLVGLRYQGRPVVGLIGQPYLDEMFVGSRLGSRLHKGEHVTPLKVRECPGLAQTLSATTDPNLFRNEEAAAFERLRTAVRLTRYGCDAYAYAMVAAGAMDLVIETGLKCWDVEAAVPLLEGAGGFVADWTGAPIGRDGGQMLLAGDQRVLDAAVETLAG